MQLLFFYLSIFMPPKKCKKHSHEVDQTDPINANNVFYVARKIRKKTLKQAASYLKVKQRYLEALEKDNFSFIEKEIYLSGLIRAYAKYLALNENEIMANYKASEHNFVSNPQSNITLVNSKVSNNSNNSNFGNFGFYLAIISNVKVYIISLMVMVLVYGLWFTTRTEKDISMIYMPSENFADIKTLNIDALYSSPLPLEVNEIAKINESITTNNFINLNQENISLALYSQDPNLLDLVANKLKASEVSFDAKNGDLIGTID